MNTKIIVPIGIGALLIVIAAGVWYMALNQPNQTAVETINESVVDTTGSTVDTDITKNTIVQENTSKNTGFSEKLPLSITSPVDKSSVMTSTIQVKGTTSPNAEVFVNDKETKADSTGNFSVSISLEEGENPIMIVANDDNGLMKEIELTVTYSSLL